MTAVDITTGEIVPVPIDPIGAIEAAADPGEFIVQACGRAKEWLTQALERGEIEQIVEIKSQAEAIRVYTMQKQLGADAELAAAEIVRRAERGIGVAIRRGQEAGEIRKKGEGSHDGREPLQNPKKSPVDYVGVGGKASDVWDMTDGVTDEQFNRAVDEAKAEGNLSRTNVKRKVKEEAFELRWDKVRRLAGEGYASRQIAAQVGISDEAVRAGCKRQGIDIPADKHVVKTRRLDHDRIVSTAVSSLEGIAMGIDMVDPDTLDPDQIQGWVTSLSASLATLTKLNKRLKEITK